MVIFLMEESGRILRSMKRRSWGKPCRVRVAEEREAPRRDLMGVWQCGRYVGACEGLGV